jgi:hypothetical protein
MSDLLLRRSAVISDCGLYRHELERRWSDDAPLLPFILLNPSTADAAVDDPTSRRCDGFARRENAGGSILANLYDFRATKPADLWRAAAPTSVENERYLLKMALQAVVEGMPIVCAWGAESKDRGQFVAQMLRGRGARLVCLGRTKGGSPRHPLYVRADQPFEPYP